jgi:hypothetical protein
MKIKKLTLNKETIRDLSADEAKEVAGGGFFGLKPTQTKYSCVDNSTAQPVCCVIFDKTNPMPGPVPIPKPTSWF